MLPIYHLGKNFTWLDLFDVLEHISDDRGMLELLGEVLVDGGYAVITVPAGPELWSYFDEASHHVRRYTAITLRDVLLAAGYEVISLTAFMSLTYPLVWLDAGVRRTKKTLKLDKLGYMSVPCRNYRYRQSLIGSWCSSFDWKQGG